jgi:hypothetical protein
MNKAINRTTVQVDSNKYRVYPKEAPLFYKKSDGTYGNIDHTFNDSSSTIGEISLMDKGVVSVGKRKGNNPHKVVGIRPDVSQDLGTEQLEFSLVNVELDEESQDFNVENDLEIKLKASKVFQLVKINKDFNNFKIEFDIHSKGLELQNTKYTKTTNIRDYGFNLVDLGEIDTSNTELTLDSFFNEDKNIPYIDCRICKITNEYITTGEYSIEEEFGDSDLSNYVFDNSVFSYGSSIYHKDCIILVAKSYNTENTEDIFVSKLCYEYGMSVIQEENKNGQYFVKDNKKIGSYFTKDGLFLASINTKEINNNIKDLFKRKTFESTSYLNISLSDFKNTLNKLFDINLKLDLDSSYYKPINDKFHFKSNDSYFHISNPLIFDEDYKNLELSTTHSLKDNEDGSYRYTKYFSTNGFLCNLYNIKYIDASLYVTHDGSPYTDEDLTIVHRSPSTGSSTALQKTSSKFTTARNASTGTGTVGDVIIDNGHWICGDLGTKTVTSGQSGTTTTYLWITYQTHYTFDSSDIESTVSDLNWVYPKAAYSTSGGSHNDISIIVLKSETEGGVVIANWNDFVGHTSGWGASDVTEYSSEYVVDGYEETNTLQRSNIASYSTESISLNSDAKSDLENDDSFKISVIDYDQYYSDSLDTSYGASASGQRLLYAGQIDATTTAYRPYLEYTVASGSVTYDANFFGVNF